MNRTAINRKANGILRKLFHDKGITTCEICGENFFLSFAHRHKRRWYYDKPVKLLWDFNQVIIACILCHNDIEKSKELTEQTFLKLRGDEKLNQLQEK